ncbi:YihY/virulence factor BrkB family protein [Streptosporangium sp. CA-135522]|uniref:YihY/virulence factor BrkB family protein n=1 Tax=Streptosporangium sp. CA-135522 TaxID=3240072 RepID=UPI003D90126A
MTVRGFTGRIATFWTRARRHGWLDHLIRAGARYDQTDGGRLSAALTYYAFFALFALGLLSFAIIGHVLDDPQVIRTVQRYLTDNFPRLDVQALRDARSTAGAIALIGLPVTGLFWMDTLRSAIRAIWRIEEYPGRFLIRQLIDLAVLAGLGVLLSACLAVAFATETLLNWLLVHTVGVDDAPTQWLLGAVAFVLGLGVNTLLAVALLTAPPRLRLPLRRVLGPALFISLGLEILKTIGQLYLGLTAANPAYQVVAGAVALLAFLKMLNQLILFAAALTATSTTGDIVDLAVRRPAAPAAAPAAISAASPDVSRRPSPASSPPARTGFTAKALRRLRRTRAPRQAGTAR